MQNAPAPSPPKNLIATSAESLAARYLNFVYAAALRQTRGNVHAAGDVTQTVMLVMLHKFRADRLPPERHMAGWLLKVTHYALMQSKRTAARRAKHEALAATNAMIPAAENERAEIDAREAMDDALLSLNRSDREVIVRRYLCGESYAQIAAVFGSSENTVGRKTSRALEKLRQLLVKRGITATVVGITGVLASECTVKAPAACAAVLSSGVASSNSADAVLWKLATTKLAIVFAEALASLALLTVIVLALVAPGVTPATPTTQPAAAVVQPMQVEPVVVKVARTLKGPSDALLQKLLADLAENQAKLRGIHVVSTVHFWNRDFETGKWSTPAQISGEAWADAGPLRQMRVNIATGHVIVMNSQPAVWAPASFVESWDGFSTNRLYGPPHSTPSAETFDNRFLHGEEIVGASFSMQLNWEKETSADQKGVQITFDRNALASTTLSQMKLSASRVVLDFGQEALELDVSVPLAGAERSRRYWFDPTHGYGLLASKTSVSLNGRVLRSDVARIDRLADAGDGVFYPAEGRSWTEYMGRPMSENHFQATKVIANETIKPELFKIAFPIGITITDYVKGLGHRRSPE